MEWYILFVKTGCESKILKILSKNLNTNTIKIFIPKRTIIFRRNGFEIIHEANCFPGYIFFECDLREKEFLINILPVIRTIDNIYKFIGYGDGYNIAIQENEKIMLKKLLGKTLCIDYSVGIIENNKVRIKSGPLMGMEGLIKKINRHKREAEIEMDILGSIRRVTVALEIVSKI